MVIYYASPDNVKVEYAGYTISQDTRCCLCLHFMQLLTLVKMQFAEYTTSVTTVTDGMHVIVPTPGQEWIVLTPNTVRL